MALTPHSPYFKYLTPGHGAPGMDTHAAQRAAPAVAAGRDHARPHHGRQPGMGWREVGGHHLLVHPWLVLAGRVQADTLWVCVWAGMLVVRIRLGPASGFAKCFDCLSCQSWFFGCTVGLNRVGSLHARIVVFSHVLFWWTFGALITSVSLSRRDSSRLYNKATHAGCLFRLLIHCYSQV